MGTKINKFNINIPNPPAGLLEKIMDRIEIERKIRLLWQRVFMLGIAFLGSLAAIIGFIGPLKSGLVDSGFFSLFSLMFTDTTAAFANWQNFSLSLLETIPATNILIFSMALVACLETLNFLTRNFKNIINIKHIYARAK